MPHSPSPALVATACLALTLAGCASNVDVAPGRITNVTDAQRVLLLAAADGPVPLVVDRPPALLGGPSPEAALAGLASKGAANATAVSFRPEIGDGGGTGVRLVYRFIGATASEPGAVCAGQIPTSGEPVSPPRVHVILCDGSRPVSDAVGVARKADAQATTALVYDTTRSLFPDTSSGLGGGFLPGISIFGGVGSGGGRSGGGVGVGLGF
jgi:hypothetical protein